MTNQAENGRDRIEDLRGQLDMAEMGFLSSRGWHHTSSTPDCVWRWEKTFGDRTLSVSRQDALSIEGVSR